MAQALTRSIERGLRVTHGRVSWTAPLDQVRDTEPVVLRTDDGLSVRLQLLRAADYPAWPLRWHDIEMRDSGFHPARMQTPTRDAFAASKTAAALFDHMLSMGPPQDHMFQRAPEERAWEQELAAQTRLTVGSSEALHIVRTAWADATR